MILILTPYFLLVGLRSDNFVKVHRNASYATELGDSSMMTYQLYTF